MRAGWRAAARKAKRYPDSQGRWVYERFSRPGSCSSKARAKPACGPDLRCLAYAQIAAGRSVAVETVLPSAKFKPCVTAAHAAGYEVALTCVSVKRPEPNIERAANRLRQDRHAARSYPWVAEAFPCAARLVRPSSR